MLAFYFLLFLQLSSFSFAIEDCTWTDVDKLVAVTSNIPACEDMAKSLHAVEKICGCAKDMTKDVLNEIPHCDVPHNLKEKIKEIGGGNSVNLQHFEGKSLREVFASCSGAPKLSAVAVGIENVDQQQNDMIDEYDGETMNEEEFGFENFEGAESLLRFRRRCPRWRRRCFRLRSGRVRCRCRRRRRRRKPRKKRNVQFGTVIGLGLAGVGFGIFKFYNRNNEANNDGGYEELTNDIGV